MNDPLLIGICGQRGSGKDTVAQFIIEWAGRRGLFAKRKSFADKLKYSAMTALGFVVSESDAVVLADDLKTIGEITTCIPDQGVLYTISGRKFLQLFGTEAHRDIFSKDFWVDALIPRDNWAMNFGHADICIVADVRFDDEAQRIQDLGGIVVEVNRPGLEEDGHASEAGISEELIDYAIPNRGTLEELKTWVAGLMREIQENT